MNQTHSLLYWYYHKIKRDNARTIASCEKGEAQYWKSRDTKNCIKRIRYPGPWNRIYFTTYDSLCGDRSSAGGVRTFMTVQTLLYIIECQWSSNRISWYWLYHKIKRCITWYNWSGVKVKLNAGNLGIRRTSSRADYSATFEKLKYASAFCFQRREC